MKTVFEQLTNKKMSGRQHRTSSSQSDQPEPGFVIYKEWGFERMF